MSMNENRTARLVDSNDREGAFSRSATNDPPVIDQLPSVSSQLFFSRRSDSETQSERRMHGN
jgi:hypothetical protein